jgi:hypothetical protein
MSQAIEAIQEALCAEQSSAPADAPPFYACRGSDTRDTATPLLAARTRNA